MRHQRLLLALVALLVGAALAGCADKTEGATTDDPDAEDDGRDEAGDSPDEGPSGDDNATAEPDDPAGAGDNSTAEPVDDNATSAPPEDNTTAEPDRTDPSEVFHDETYESGTTEGEGAFESPEAYRKLVIGVQSKAGFNPLESPAYTLHVTGPSGNTTTFSGAPENSPTPLGDHEPWCEWHVIEPGENGEWTYTFERTASLELRIVAQGYWQHGVPGNGTGACA